MKILLVHPDDLVETGPWTETAWDLIIDLGWSGRYSYSQQASQLGCRVLGIYDLLDHAEHRCHLRDLLRMGLNQLVDSESIDWWDVFSSFIMGPLEQLTALSAMAEKLPECAEIHATHPHFATRALSILLKREIKAFLPDLQTGFAIRAKSFAKRAFALRPSQVVEIAFDKWDTDYRLRRLLSQRPRASTEPAVLLPSAYVNVSRAQLAYAQMLPHRRFLLVVTRGSGRRLKLPANVELRSLASYAPGFSPSTEKERIRLMGMWHDLWKDGFRLNRVLSLALRLGTFDMFANLLRNGLRIRDAWRNVLTNERLTAVLSGDENNPFTRLPILLAKPRKLATVHCDHGALNMTFGIRPACSDVYLASGDMARDYLVNWCGLPADKVIVGAPQSIFSSSRSGNRTERDWIVFFSEAYELSFARAQALYSELLPELCSLARQAGRKVIVKLHPFESRRMRKAMIDKALSPEQRCLVEMRVGPMTPDIFERAWFSVTLESSVAVESTMNGVPCFLCGWFDGSWYGYGKQFAKYSAAYSLNSPQEIRRIPHLLEQIKITDATRRALHTPISGERLEAVLTGVESSAAP